MTKKTVLFLFTLVVVLLLGGALSLTTALAAGTTYQAENATRGGGVNVVTTGTGFFGTGYVNFPASGGYVEFRNVDGGAGGRTLLRFRYKLGSTSSNTGWLTVNGISRSITFIPTGAWDKWAIREVTANLNSGTSNTIRLGSNGQYLANLDQMEVLPDPFPIYQAEDATRGGGVNYITTGTGFIGTGYVNFPASGGYVEFRNVDGGAGGSKSLRFRYKLSSVSSNTGRLTVNGVNQDITFTPTGAWWDNWTIHSVTVNLNSGTSNTIRLESNGQYLANLDQLELGCSFGTYPTNAFASLSMSPTALEVGQTATITVSSTGVMYPHYMLYADNARIALFRNAAGGIEVLNESPIIRFVSGSVPGDDSTPRTAVLEAIAPGKANLWVYANGQTVDFIDTGSGCGVEFPWQGTYSNAVPVSISGTP